MLQRLILLPLLAGLLMAAAPHDAEERAICAGLEVLQQAALSGDTAKAAELLAEDLVLVSQSGKVYPREIVIADLGSGFVSWANSDVKMQVDGATAVVVLINRRQRKGLEEGAFRVMQVWRKREEAWLLVAQSSARIS